MKRNIANSYLLFVIILLFPAILSAQKEKIKLPDQLLEVSGLYIENSNSLWWINDSGNAADLYQTDGEGNLLQTIPLPIKNKDWEDLTYDDKGNIYIGDFGNNRNRRQDLKIYIYNIQTKMLDSISFVYPDQKLFPPPRESYNFNMEGFFWHQDSLHLFSKNIIKLGNYYTKHYSVLAQPGTQSVHLRDSVYLKNRVVTAAAISPDGQAVALLAYEYGRHLGFFPKSKASVFLIQNFENTNYFDGLFTAQKLHFCSPVTQYESLDFWTNEKVLIASEKAKFYKQQAQMVKLKKRQIVLP